MVGIVDEGGNLGLKVLQSLDIEADDLRAELMGSMPPKTAAAVDNPGYAPGAMRALELTAKEAMSLGHNYIGCEHILLGVLATEDTMGAQVLHRMGVDVRSARRAVVAALSGFVHATDQATPATPPATDACSRRDPPPPRRDRAAPRERVSDNARRVNVRYDVEGPLGIVRLDRPEKLNAFTFEMVGEIRSADRRGGVRPDR